MADSNEIHNERSDPVKAGRATSRRTRHRPPSSTNGPLTTWRDLLAEGPPLIAELLGDQVAQRHVQLAAWRNAPANTRKSFASLTNAQHRICGITFISKSVASHPISVVRGPFEFGQVSKLHLE